MQQTSTPTNAEQPASTPKILQAVQREVLPHKVLFTVLALELVFLAWLLATPSAFRKPPTAVAAPTASAMQVQVTDDAVVGGSLSAPVAPMSAPAGKNGKAKDGGRVAVAAGGDLVVHLAIRGAAGDALVAASSPAAATAALATVDGAPAASIPADGAAEILLGGLADAIDKGGSVPVTLTFEQAGEVEIDVPVWRNGKAAAGNPTEPVAAGAVTIERAWAEPAS